MYVTRPISLYKNSPNAAFEQPLGPNSGVLVIQDEESEAQATCCWGFCKNNRIYELPFPQNKILTVKYSTGAGESRRTYCDTVFFIPVIDQPLSSNRYYVVRGKGRDKGKACSCSTEEEMSTCCFCLCINDVKPSPFDYRDIYQQVEIIGQKGWFYAKSIASDGFPPRFLRRKHWEIYMSKPSNYNYLDEASGMDMFLRKQKPEFSFSITEHSPAVVVVGKWYCPFTFIKEDEKLRDQMKKSMFYEMTLLQFWEEIYTCENSDGATKLIVEVNVSVLRETPLLYGNELVHDNQEAIDGVIWFKPINTMGEGLGLSLAIWERMRWEEGRGGWVGGKEKVERVERVEEFGGVYKWKKFGCYVLVERFVLKRMDGSLALTYDFKHTNTIRTKWE